MAKKQEKTELPSWIWLWLPLALWLVPYIFTTFNKKLYEKIFFTEFGILENITLVFLIVGLIYSIKIVRLSSKSKKSSFDFNPRLIKIFFILYALACFYFAGEEASWGMHFFGWEPSAEFLEAMPNKQGETNIHNMLDMRFRIFTNFLPHILLTTSAIALGTIFPIVRKIGDIKFDPKSIWYWFMPTFLCVPSAALGAFVTMPKKLFRLFFEKPDLPAAYYAHQAESKETFLASFIMIFALSFYYRMKTHLKA